MAKDKQTALDPTKNNMVGIPKEGKARKIANKVMQKTGLEKKNLKAMQKDKNKPLEMPYLQH
jgi:hypothetical protein